MRFGIRKLVAVVTGWVLLSYGLLGFLFSEYYLRSDLFLVFFSRRVTSTDLVYFFVLANGLFFSFSVLAFWPFNA